MSPKEDNFSPPQLQLLPPATITQSTMLSLPPRHKSLKRSTKHPGLVLVEGNPLVEKANEKPESSGYQSKNLITERKRRNRIKDGLFTLRALVPKITKVRLLA